MSPVTLLPPRRTAVSVPADFGYTPPFTVEQLARRRFGARGFSLQAHAGIAVAKTYYVDGVSGNDANDGLTWATALKKESVAAAKADVDRIRIRNAYLYKDARSSFPNRSIEVICDDDSVDWTADVTNKKTSGWTLVGSHYEATFSEFVATAWDASIPDALGNPTQLVAQANSAAVEANPGSVYVSFSGGVSTVYVRTADSRAPDANISVHDSQAGTFTRDGRTIYVEGIRFGPGFNAANSTAAGGTRAYFKRCRFSGLTVEGVEEFITQDCTNWRAKVNYKAKNGIVTRAVEINLDSGDILGGATAQASSAEGNSSVVTIGGRFHHCGGQCVADIGAGTKRWILGAELDHSGTGIGLHTGGTVWADGIHTHDNATYDLQATAGGIIHTRNAILEKGVNDIAAGATLTGYYVDLAAGFPWRPPFLTQQVTHAAGAGAMQVEPSFSLRGYILVPTGTVYYVDPVGGNDANPGTSGSMLKTLFAAMGKPDVRRIITKAGYFYKNQRRAWPGRSLELLAYGDGPVYFTCDVGNVAGAWTLVGSRYEAPLIEFVAKVTDESNLDASGLPTFLTPVASAALVSSTPNSFYSEYPTKIHVHTFDGRAPDASIKLYDSQALTITQNGILCYAEGISFMGGTGIAPASSAGGLKVGLKDCVTWGATVAGADEFFIQDSTSFYNELNYDWDASHTIFPKVAEINVHAYRIIGNATTQASTGHNGCIIVTVDPDYHNSDGQNIADAGAATRRLVLGGHLHDSVSGIGLYTEGQTWLDHVRISGQANYDLQNTLGATIRTRLCTLEKGVNDIAGTLTPY